jgi:hypothetical protein
MTTLSSICERSYAHCTNRTPNPTNRRAAVRLCGCLSPRNTSKIAQCAVHKNSSLHRKLLNHRYALASAIRYGITAIASISIRISSRNRRRTSTAVLAGGFSTFTN